MSASEPAGALAVAIVDIDRFKVIKSSLGHQIGDALLAEVAERISHHIGAENAVGRSTGDAFMLLFEDVADLACHQTSRVSRRRHRRAV